LPFAKQKKSRRQFDVKDWI